MTELLKSSPILIFLFYFLLNRIAYNKYMSLQGDYVDKLLTHRTFEKFLFDDSEHMGVKRIVLLSNFFQFMFFISLFFSALSINVLMRDYRFLLIFFGFAILASAFNLTKQLYMIFKQRTLL